MRWMSLCFSGVLLCSLSACNLVHKVSVYQGNSLDKEDVESVKLGMSKKQVAFLLGTPAITSPFHQHRWDYTASIGKNGHDPEIKNLTLYFEGEVLVRTEGHYFDEPPENILQNAKDLHGAGPGSEEIDGSRQ